jgi:ribosomal protein S26
MLKNTLRKCPHSKVELLGEQKGERGANKYYKCLKCGNVLVLSEDGVLYEVPGVDATSLKENLDQKQRKER